MTTPTPPHAAPATRRRKLIEVDLPLDHINRESAREKSIRHGHPSTLHLWWARRPLASCRAVIFASMVDDPIDLRDEFETEDAVRDERERLHEIIRDLVVWENTDERNAAARDVLAKARYEIARSIARSPDKPDAPPRTDPAAVLRYLADNALPIYDPFAGGGSIPLEAQRLGMKAIATDLNPVAVLINKALIELPRKFAGKPPVNPDADPLGMTTGRGKRAKQVAWSGAAGLADDIRYYGKWMREQAHERIGHFYPKAKLPDGGEATVIAWLWARTIPCPNPACGAAMPLMTTFEAYKQPNSKNRSKDYWMKPIVNRDTHPPTISFQVQNHDEGMPKIESTVVNGGKGATCLACDAPVTQAYIRDQSKAGNMNETMTCIVAEDALKRVFLSPIHAHIQAAQSAKPNIRSIPTQKMPATAYKVSGRGYGIQYWRELFTQRQLAALTTFVDLIGEVGEQILKDCDSDDRQEYANTIQTYLALSFGRLVNGNSRFNKRDKARVSGISGVFARQAIPMVWDFAEANPFGTSQSWKYQVDWVANAVERLPAHTNAGQAFQADATTTIHAESGPVIVTDPPYYDNISYAELSDFFYVWLRPLLRDVYPELFAGILVPIQEEMIAAPRFDAKGGESARERFERLMNETLRLIRERCSPEFPSSIFYAYKQQEETRQGRTSTGWDTMLTALVNAGFQIVGSWPMRTELSNRSNSLGANTLASSVILVCRPRLADAPSATRREFLSALERELPAALDRLTREGHIAPVDLAQAAIGPGMQIYSGYSSVQTIAGEPVSVRDALEQINRVIGEYHSRERGALDEESQFCFDWLREHNYAAGDYGSANTLAQAKNVAIEDNLRDAHRLLIAEGGKVRLLGPEEYHPGRKMPSAPMTAWEGCFRMAYHMDAGSGGDETIGFIQGAAGVARAMGSASESAERLARLLYAHYDGKRDAANAARFNRLVASWQQITERAMQLREETQAPLGV